MYQNPYQMQFMPPYPYGQTLRNTYGNERDFYSQQINAQQQQQQNMYVPQQQPMQMQSNIEYVNGIEGAKAFMLPPNAQKLLLVSDNPFFYIKTTDQQGKPVVKRFKYIDIDAEQQAQQKDTQPQAQPNPLYVTLEQYQNLMDMVDIMRQEIDSLKATKTKKTSESEVKK
jgi:hypothetical protein